MVKWVAAATLCCVASGAWGQTVMDGSEKNLSEGRLEKLQQVMRANLKDPFAAQILGLYEAKDGWICGKVNNKNSMGGYVGFVFFVSRPERDYFTMTEPLNGSESLGLLELHSEFLNQMLEICRNKN